jgi:hypothetical protein
VGYERFAGLIAGQCLCLARLYESVRRHVNFFQQSFQLKSKVRIGAKVKKSYHPPATPCDRLLAPASVLEPVKESEPATMSAVPGRAPAPDSCFGLLGRRDLSE